MSDGVVASAGAGPDLWVELPRDAPPELVWVVRVVCDWLAPGVLIRTPDGDADASTVLFTDGTRRLAIDAQGFGSDGYGDLVISSSRTLAALPRDRVPADFARMGWEALAPVDAKGFTRTSDRGWLNVPSFGVIFECLTCLHEIRFPIVDHFGRSPRAVSAMALHDGGMRPIADEHVRLIRTALEDFWPDLTRRPSAQSPWLTCDVDHVVDPSCRSVAGALRRSAAVALRLRDDEGPIRVVGRYFRSRLSGGQLDPYQIAIRYLMDVAERAETRAQFFFIPFVSDPQRDRGSSLDQEPHRRLALEILERGHDVGIHPGFATFRDPAQLRRCVDSLRAVHAASGMRSSVICSRQHYLRWDHACTPSALDGAGVDLDSTLGFSEGVGFRCGTSRRFNMFDVHGRRPLRIQQAPLIAMDVACLARRRTRQADEVTREQLSLLRKRCDEHGGTFTCLWHNSELTGAATRAMVEASILGAPTSAKD